MKHARTVAPTPTEPRDFQSVHAMNVQPVNDLGSLCPRPLWCITGEQAHACRRAAGPKEPVWAMLSAFFGSHLAQTAAA